MIIFNFLRVCSVHAKMLYIRYFMWYINYLHLIASLRQENPGETIVPMLWPGPGGDGGVSDPACPGTTMVSRRWVTSSPAFADHASNTGELQLLWPARCTSTANCQHWPPHPNWGAAAHLLNGHHFSFLVSFLAEKSYLGVSGPFYPACTQRFRICPLLAGHVPAEWKLHYLYFLFQCHGHRIKIFC